MVSDAHRRRLAALDAGEEPPDEWLVPLQELGHADVGALLDSIAAEHIEA